MRLAVINGNPDPTLSELEDYLAGLKKILLQTGHQVVDLQLREMKIIPCQGCFGCWVKTPGLCLYKDGTRQICQEVVKSDLVVFASPLIMGYTSALLKHAQDKLIPILHPYIELVNNWECHHEKRYDHYPLLGLIVQPEADTDQRDLEIVRELYERFALDFKTTLAFMHSTSETLVEVADEIDHL